MMTYRFCVLMRRIKTDATRRIRVLGNRDVSPHFRVEKLVMRPRRVA